MFETKIIRSTLNGRVGNEQVVYILQFVGFQKSGENGLCVVFLLLHFPF